MADETPDYWPGDWFGKESTRAKDMQSNPQAMIPALPQWGQHTQATARDTLLSALIGSGEGAEASQSAARMGDPLAAVVAGITGSMRGVAKNSPQQIAQARAKQAADAQMAQLESIPISQVSPKLVAEFGLDPNTPLGLVQKIAPLLQRQHGLEQQLALFMAAEKGRNVRNERSVEGAADRQENKDERAIRTEERQLRNELQTKSKDFVTIRDNYARINDVSKKPSPAGDLSMIFSYMKLLDPGSVVRESEFKNAEVAKPLMARMGLDFNTLSSVWEGKKLNDAQRADFLARAKELYDSQKRQHDATRAEYRRLAEVAGGKAANVDVIGGADLGTSGDSLDALINKHLRPK